jgi:hypothetical protein
MYYGKAKPLPIILCKAPGKTHQVKLLDAPNIMGKGQAVP